MPMSLEAYTVHEPDHQLSPFTGMTRSHWIEAGRYILGRAFRHVHDFDQLLIFPVVPESKTYPQPDDPDWRYRSLEFEGLRRTTTIAAPLLHVDPELTIGGIHLHRYYCHHLYRALTPGHPNSIPLPGDLPDANYQFTCELGGLAMFLLRFPDVIWPRFEKQQQDAMAQTLSAWAHHRTTQNNWRFFNICMLSFLKLNGYAIDEDLMRSHLDWIASYHSGDGWYLEQNYNYYTISMYSLYQTVWARAYGDRYEPAMVRLYEKTVHQLLQSLPYLFARNGYINMWARSIVYRLWVAGGLPIAFMLRQQPELDPGWARRLCSGALLQFAGRPDFYENDVPSLGFYRHVEYCLQGYSCSASPFTMFMPFLALSLPEDSPFWTARENEGFWESLGTATHTCSLPKPGLLLTNHGPTGTSEILPAKVNEEDHNYNRLCYNTHFPWEDHNPRGGTAMVYSFRSLDPRDTGNKDTLFYLGLRSKSDSDPSPESPFSTPHAMFYNGFRDGVLYRQVILRTPPNNGSGYLIDLADIPLPGGVLRIDRCRLAFEHQLTLGHFGLPHLDGREPVFTTAECRGYPMMTGAVAGRRIAMILLSGWDGFHTVTHEDRNAEAHTSSVLHAHRDRRQKNPPMELMACLLLHKTTADPWTDEELFPLDSIQLHEYAPSGSPLGAGVRLRDGSSLCVDFNEIDGFRQC